MMLPQFGRYATISELGEGGFAKVYLAQHAEIKRLVAIKAFVGDLDNDGLDRFVQEAQIIANLEKHHHCIVAVHDIDTHHKPPFIVMRYMSGGTLDKRMSGNPLPLSEIKPILQRLADALDAAHSQAIVHRDIKPSNVLFDEDGKAFLSDFGVAKLLGSSIKELPGEPVGTPLYMSPEQARGEPIGHLSDIYSLGLLLYEMLAGAHFCPNYGSPYAPIRFFANDPDPEPIVNQLTTPPEIKSILNIALSKNKTQRYQSAGDLARAINRASPSPIFVLDTSSAPVQLDMLPVQPDMLATFERSAETPVRPIPSLFASPKQNPIADMRLLFASLRDRLGKLIERTDLLGAVLSLSGTILAVFVSIASVSLLSNISILSPVVLTIATTTLTLLIMFLVIIPLAMAVFRGKAVQRELKLKRLLDKESDFFLKVNDDTSMLLNKGSE